MTARHRPPAWATAVVRLGIPTRERETVLAELDELYAFHVERDGKRRALCWYLGQGFSFLTMGLRARASDDALETVTGSARAARMAWSAEVMQDIRFAVRGFLKAPGFAAIAVCTIAIGFGLNSSVFSVVNGVVLRPLPYPEADRLVRLWPEWAVSMEQFDRISDRTESLVELSAFGTEWYTVVGEGSEGGEGSGVATGLSVTPNHFMFFGVQPIMGRPMLASDARPTAQNTVWLGHALWRSQFGGDSSIVGRSIDVLLFTTLPMAPGAFAGERYQVAGVMPEGFEPLGEPVDLWLPLIRVPGSGIYADFGDLEVLGRLEPGVTVAALAPTLTAILEQEFPDGDEPHAFEALPVVTLHQALVGGVRPLMLATLVAVGLVLLAACVNVATLMLVRGAGRSRELAVRAALGATRRRLVRQLMTETVVLSVAGAGLGLVLAQLTLPIMVGVLPADLPRVSGISLDGTVLAATGLALAGGLVAFGLLPALRSIPTGWTTHGPGGQGPGGLRAFRGLIAVELALATFLTVGAGLLLDSFWRLTHVEPGFVTTDVAVTQLAPSARHYAEIGRRRQFFAEVLSRTREIPGVSAAGAIHRLPMADQGVGIFYSLPGYEPEDGERLSTQYRIITPGYLDALEIPMLRGREFTEGDRADATEVGIINQAMADRHWLGEDPLGRRFSRSNGNDWFTVIGVVGDVRQFRPDVPAEPEVYLPLEQAAWASAMAVVVRSSLTRREVGNAVAAIASEIDPSVPVAWSRSMDDVVLHAIETERFYLGLFGLFGLLALVLSSIGVYGVMAHTVGLRQREIGIRLALGASKSKVVRTMLGKVAGAALVGIIAGLAVSIMGGRAIASLLFGVGYADTGVLLSVSLILGGIAFLAGWFPSRRAAALDPMATLRAE